jgi:hypothetical protein
MKARNLQHFGICMKIISPLGEFIVRMSFISLQLKTQQRQAELIDAGIVYFYIRRHHFPLL